MLKVRLYFFLTIGISPLLIDCLIRYNISLYANLITVVSVSVFLSFCPFVSVCSVHAQNVSEQGPTLLTGWVGYDLCNPGDECCEGIEVPLTSCTLAAKELMRDPARVACDWLSA